MTHDPDLQDIEYEHRLQEQHEQRYRAALSRAPDCRDPDHPGCQYCEEEDDEQ